MAEPLTAETVERATELITLRPYQEAALAAIRDAETRGVRCQLVALPTGAGKTICFARHIADAYAAGMRGKVLVVAHRDELIAQAADKIRSVLPDASIGIVKGERNELAADILICSIQTLARPKRRAALSRDVGLVIIDEAHHSAARSYRTLIEATGAGQPGGPLLLGFTATPERGDGQGLGHIFSEIVYESRLLDLIEQGWLCDLRGIAVKYQADYSKLKMQAGDITDKSAAEAFLAGGGPAAVTVALERHAAGRKSLVFVPDVQSARETAAAIDWRGIPAAAVWGDQPLEERRATLARFAAGELRALINCSLLTEGYDEPSVDCVVIARPTRSRAFYAQMLGRGTRLHEGKHDCLVVDLTGASGRHDLLSAASLVGLGPTELEPGESLTKAVARRRLRVERAAVRPTDVAIDARPVDLFRRRPTQWVAAANGHLVLTLGQHGRVELYPHGGHGGWSAVVRGSDGPARMLANNTSLEYAKQAGELYARQLGVDRLIDARARWRDDPPSDKQLAFARSLGVGIPPNATKGVISDLISAAQAGRIA